MRPISLLGTPVAAWPERRGGWQSGRVLRRVVDDVGLFVGLKVHLPSHEVGGHRRTQESEFLTRDVTREVVHPSLQVGVPGLGVVPRHRGT